MKKISRKFRIIGGLCLLALGVSVFAGTILSAKKTQNPTEVVELGRPGEPGEEDDDRWKNL